MPPRLNRRKKPVRKPRAKKQRVIRKNKVKAAATFFAQGKTPVFEIAPPSLMTLSERTIIPQNYGDHKIVLQVRDPWYLHAYWELSSERTSRKEQQLKQRGLSVEKWVLRLYEESSGFPVKIREDILLTQAANNWYLQVEHDHFYYVEIGIVANDRSFHPLARSNKVKTPRFGMSGVIDEQWKCLGEEYWEIFALSGGFGIGSSHMEDREYFLQQKAGQHVS
ncbi:MAG: DUF4912 domain-containing protein [Candidatus Omnitrophica bacterium]|nr:DUF4912 domain-containing protein [Candidatus Omnitrophota bacterium]